MSTADLSGKRDVSSGANKPNSDLSIQIAEYEKKITDLTDCNRALSLALEKSYKIIEQHEKVISELQKKLDFTKPQLFREKLHGLGKCIRQLTDFRDEALFLLSSSSNLESDVKDEIPNSSESEMCVPNNTVLRKRDVGNLHIPTHPEEEKNPVKEQIHPSFIKKVSGTASNRIVNGSETRHLTYKISLLKTKKQSSVSEKKEIPKKANLKPKKKVDKIMKIKISKPLKRKASCSEEKVTQDKNSILVCSIAPSTNEKKIAWENEILAVPSTSKAKQFKPRFNSKKSTSKSNRRSQKVTKRTRNNSDSDIIVISDDGESPRKQGSFVKNCSDNRNCRPNNSTKRDSAVKELSCHKKPSEESLQNSSSGSIPLKLPRVILHDILKYPEFRAEPFILKHSNIKDVCVSEKGESSDSEMPHLVPDVTTEDVVSTNNDVEAPLVSDLETGPVSLGDSESSVPLGIPDIRQEVNNNFGEMNVEPEDSEPVSSRDHCEDSFFRLLEEVTNITEKLLPAS